MIFNTSFSNITVLKISVPIPTRTGGALTYNGSVQSPTWNYDSSLVKLVSGNSGTDAGTYNTVFELYDPSNYMWEDKGTANKSIQWEIERATISEVPSQSGTLTYNGNVQSASWQNYDSNKMTTSGTTSAIDANTYTIEFTPTSNYKWADGSIGTKIVQWTIGKKTIANVPSQSGTLTYNGNTLTPTWNNYNPLELDISNDTSGVNAGDYTATFTPNKNCEWSDHTSTSKNVPWTIGRFSISTTPSQDGTLEYTGSVISPTWKNYDPNMLNIDGNTSGTNAGSYDVTFTPNSNYKWWDNTTTSKTVTWVISKANVTITVNPTSLSLDENNTSGTITVTRNSTGAITATSSDTTVATVEVNGTTVNVTGTSTGNTSISISVASDENYNSGSIQVHVVSDVPLSGFIISASVNPENGGKVTGQGVYEENSNVTLEAIPNEDYKFTDWSKSVESILPKGYTRIEFVSTDEYARIPTGINATIDTTRVVMDVLPIEHRNFRSYFFDAINYYSSSYTYSFGLRNNETDGSMNWFSGYWGNSSGGYAAFNYSFEYGKRITIDMDCVTENIKIGNTSISISPAKTTSVKDAGELNFGGYYPEDSSAYTQIMNIYSAKVYLGGTLKGDFIPCIKLDGTVGMYDLINEKFYSASHGTLTAGPKANVISTENPYTFIATQNTNLIANFDSKYILGKDWFESTLPSSNNWSSVAYGDNKFVAIATNSDEAAYSEDGITWNSTNLPSSSSWSCVTYGNGKFVVISRKSNKVAYSSNGINWNESELSSSANWKTIAYGNGKFIAIAYESNKLTYSNDGINWTDGTLYSNSYWNAVTYGVGKFVAVAGNVTKISNYSEDGINWEYSALPEPAQWYGIVYGEDKFVVVGYNNVCLYSFDGIAWETTPLPFKQPLMSISYGDSTFCAIANNERYGENNIAYSTDGINWAMSISPSKAAWNAIAYGNGKFVAIATGSNKVAYSSKKGPPT